jgi:beta-lactam-binding protein with PASTA domain
MGRQATDRVTVPATMGTCETKAVLMLSTVGLKAAVVHDKSHGSRGYVVLMSPPAGTELERGSTVTITVSRH